MNTKQTSYYCFATCATVSHSVFFKEYKLRGIKFQNFIILQEVALNKNASFCYPVNFPSTLRIIKLSIATPKAAMNYHWKTLAGRNTTFTDMTIPTKQLQNHPSSPWVTKDLAATVNEKNIAFS